MAYLGSGAKTLKVVQIISQSWTYDIITLQKVCDQSVQNQKQFIHQLCRTFAPEPKTAPPIANLCLTIWVFIITPLSRKRKRLKNSANPLL
ncbi:hypothetical protein COL93_27525 [Bacillus toyonensis]|uniref:Uncharacterized protein n=1 Tax=Bacillus toyonensis TaxID=155322 RepID=A0A2C4PZ98_9BACI|nr:hypothetical protein COL93_27525 [Bacillus toyonensis]PHD58127.1 hypothetical protein COF40_29000 [Bacillus toyonensis]